MTCQAASGFLIRELFDAKIKAILRICKLEMLNVGSGKTPREIVHVVITARRAHLSHGGNIRRRHGHYRRRA